MTIQTLMNNKNFFIRYGMKFTPCLELVEDAFQMAAIRYAKTTGIKTPRQYFKQILRNELFDYMTQRKTQLIPRAFTDSKAEQLFMDRQVYTESTPPSLELTDLCTTPVQLKYLQLLSANPGKTMATVARENNINVNTFKHQIRRFKKGAQL